MPLKDKKYKRLKMGTEFDVDIDNNELSQSLKELELNKKKL